MSAFSLLFTGSTVTFHEVTDILTDFLRHFPYVHFCISCSSEWSITSQYLLKVQEKYRTNAMDSFVFGYKLGVWGH